MTDTIKDLWRNADAVCFDVDSTVIQEEAIDEVAKFCNKGSEVQKLYDYCLLIFNLKYFYSLSYSCAIGTYLFFISDCMYRVIQRGDKNSEKKIEFIVKSN